MTKMTVSGFGRIVNDLSVRFITNNTAVLDFTLAIDEYIGSKDGEKKKITHFLDFQAWSSGAETIAKYAQKGDLIYVIASPRKDVWEKDGEKRSKVYFRVDEFRFLPSNRIPPNEGKSPSTSSTPPQPEDDIPF